MDGMKMACICIGVGVMGGLAGFGLATAAIAMWKLVFRIPVRGLAQGMGAVHADDWDPEQSLAHVVRLTRQDEEFGRVWDRHVRDASDELTAKIAGQHMAGAVHGAVEYIARVPTPSCMSDEKAHDAFRLAVINEVTARVNAMTGPGDFG